VKTRNDQPCSTCVSWSPANSTRWLLCSWPRTQLTPITRALCIWGSHRGPPPPLSQTCQTLLCVHHLRLPLLGHHPPAFFRHGGRRPPSPFYAHTACIPPLHSTSANGSCKGAQKTHFNVSGFKYNRSLAAKLMCSQKKWLNSCRVLPGDAYKSTIIFQTVRNHSTIAFKPLGRSLTT
jgi:hypothetical protein